MNFFESFFSSLVDGGESIIDVITSLGSRIFVGIFSFLPDGGTFPQSFHDAFIYFGNTLASVDVIFPTSTLIYCVSFIFAIKFALFGVHFIRVIINYVRGIDTTAFNG